MALRPRSSSEPGERQPPKPCGFEGCTADAIYRVRRSTGWLNCCNEHYLHVANLDAREWNAHHGITNRAQAIGACRKMAQAMRHRLPVKRVTDRLARAEAALPLEVTST